MNAIDSPLEALAFNYGSFAFFTLVNNLWTWLALLTAALSLWKIRAKPHLPPPPPPSNDRSLNGSRSTEDERPVENIVLHEAPGTSEPAAAGVFSVDDGDVVDGVTKGKFTVYYEEDSSECESDEELTESEVSCNGGSGVKSEWWEKWEETLKMRMGVSGWYMYQDLTDLNGNVVRFWDSGVDDSRFAKEVRLYSSSCIVG